MSACMAICLLSSPSYCAGGPDSDFEYSTQSYTGYEPTSYALPMCTIGSRMRAIRGRYDPYIQARSRIEQLRRLGHEYVPLRAPHC